MKLPVLLGLAILLPTAVVAQEVHHEHKSAYAEDEARAIKSLSDDDISELRRGGGLVLLRPPNSMECRGRLMS